MNSRITLINDIVEGVITFTTKESGKTVMSFDTTTIKRFCILFAFRYRNSWRIRFALVITTKYGAMGFRITKTLRADEHGRFCIPKSWEQNTVLLFGIQPNNNDVHITMRIFANDNGLNIEPYESQLSWDFQDDHTIMSNELLPTNAMSRSFSKQLYDDYIQEEYVADQNVLELQHGTQSLDNDLNDNVKINEVIALFE